MKGGMPVRRLLLAGAAVLALSMAFVAPAATSSASAGGWRGKVAFRVLRDTAGGKSASFVVRMASQADVSGAAWLSTKLTKGRFVFDTLRAHAARTQDSVRALLSFTVGAITFENGLATFSSRGPATFQGMRIKPDMVAPGEDVRSSWPPNTYAYESGTSMASPHIVGVIALVYSAKPSLIGNVDATEADRADRLPLQLLGVQQQRHLPQQPVTDGDWPTRPAPPSRKRQPMPGRQRHSWASSRSAWWSQRGSNPCFGLERAAS